MAEHQQFRNLTLEYIQRINHIANIIRAENPTDRTALKDSVAGYKHPVFLIGKTDTPRRMPWRVKHRQSMMSRINGHPFRQFPIDGKWCEWLAERAP